MHALLVKIIVRQTDVFTFWEDHLKTAPLYDTVATTIVHLSGSPFSFIVIIE
jgi:hypothetical protein